MKAYITVKRDSSIAADCALRTADCLLKKGAEVVLAQGDTVWFSNLPCGIQIADSAQTALAFCDVVVAVGGDGTIFHAAADGMEYEKPVLGINAGRLGFLAQLEGSDLSRLDDLVSGSYAVENCFVIEAEIFHPENGEHICVPAVNDVVISKPEFGHISDIEVRCFGDLVGQYRADGIIFATPTGSTAYSLSAGGPISDPTVNCILMTPLAPHSLVSRTIIFGKDKVLDISTPQKSGEKLYVSVDGITIGTIGGDDVLTIKKSKHKTRFIRLSGRSFYQILNEKMKHRV